MQILDDLKKSPLEKVIALACKRYKGIQKLVEEFGEANIGYSATGGTEIFDNHSENGLEEALDKIDFINGQLKIHAGLESVFEIKKGSAYNMNCKDTNIFNRFEGMLNSGMLNETISYKAHGMGIIPFYGFNASNLQELENGYELTDADGVKITCSQLILANNAFASQLMPDLDVVPARGQVIITKPIDNISFNGTFHSDKGYIYFRNIDNRILIGGGRNHFEKEEETYSFEGSGKIRQYLEDYLRRVVIPGRHFETDMHWSGIMAMGQEKIPIVRRINQNLLACVRMSGMGVALGPVLSDEIAEMV